jgi:hypothetical protein
MVKQEQSGEHKTPPVVLVIAWMIVGIPLLWGVAQVLINSLALFR